MTRAAYRCSSCGADGHTRPRCPDVTPVPRETPSHRAALLARDTGRSYASVASELGISPQAVHQAWHRLRLGKRE